MKEPRNVTTSRQVAALPFEVRRCGSVRVLLVTSRETGRYVIPKGWPWRGHRNCDAALREAWEEAGVDGKILAPSIGHYSYEKRLHSAVLKIRVKVFLLHVSELRDDWPERAQRQRLWLSTEAAAAAVSEPELSRLIRRLPDVHGNAGWITKDQRNLAHN